MHNMLTGTNEADRARVRVRVRVVMRAYEQVVLCACAACCW